MQVPTLGHVGALHFVDEDDAEAEFGQFAVGRHKEDFDVHCEREAWRGVGRGDQGGTRGREEGGAERGVVAGESGVPGFTDAAAAEEVVDGEGPEDGLEDLGRGVHDRETFESLMRGVWRCVC
jgi:hypothetical protein